MRGRTELHNLSNAIVVSCPIYAEGTLGGETIRRSLDHTNWEAASEVVAKWTASGQIGVARLDIPDIKDTVDKYFEDGSLESRFTRSCTRSRERQTDNERSHRQTSRSRVPSYGGGEWADASWHVV